MLVEDITIWLVKLAQDAMAKGKSLVESVAHVVGVKLCLELKISLYWWNLAQDISKLSSFIIWATK